MLCATALGLHAKSLASPPPPPLPLPPPSEENQFLSPSSSSMIYVPPPSSSMPWFLAFQDFRQSKLPHASDALSMIVKTERGLLSLRVCWRNFKIQTKNCNMKYCTFFPILFLISSACSANKVKKWYGFFSPLLFQLESPLLRMWKKNIKHQLHSSSTLTQLSLNHWRQHL